jgi:hypothetical protein
MSIVFKNFILFFLIVIIFHFLIINELVKTNSRIYNRGINVDTNSQYIYGSQHIFPNTVDTNSQYIYGSQHIFPKTGNHRSNSNQVVSHNKFELDEKFVLLSKKDREYKNVETENVAKNNEVDNEQNIDMKDVKPHIPKNCEDMTRTSTSKSSTPNMKELYDFVFDDSEKSSIDAAYGVSNVAIQDIDDNKEISNHHNLVTKSIDFVTETQQQLLYDYQVIGQIDTNIGDGLMGIDSMLSGNFSKVI